MYAALHGHAVVTDLLIATGALLTVKQSLQLRQKGVKAELVARLRDVRCTDEPAAKRPRTAVRAGSRLTPATSAPCTPCYTLGTFVCSPCTHAD
jgi:hypothetical protein